MNQPLIEYIDMYHNGNGADFGRSLDPPVDRKMVSKWVAAKYWVLMIDREDKKSELWLFSPRRPLIKE